MRRARFLAALVLAVSCGGAPTPTSPSASVPSAGFLPTGVYTLSLGQAMVSTCQNGFCTSVTLCVGPSPPGALSASVRVNVQRDGDRVTVTGLSSDDSFRMTLQTDASTVSGAVSGSMAGTNGANVSASGTVTGSFSAVSNAVSGPLDGELSIGGMSCSNTQYFWSLGSH